MVDFDSKFNTKELAEKIKAAQDNAPTGEFKEVPAGKYEVKIEKCELAASKKGDPMCKIQFRIVDGDYKNQCLFYNKVLCGKDKETGEDSPLPLHYNNLFLKSLQVFDEEEIKFTSFKAYADLLLDIAEECDKSKLTFDVEYSVKNDYPNYKILATHEN